MKRSILSISALPEITPTSAGRAPLNQQNLPTYGWREGCVHVSNDPALAGKAMSTIGEAIQETRVSGVGCIVIHPGIYTERFCLNSSLRLQGAGRGRSIIRVVDQDGNGRGVCVHSGNLNLSDLTLECPEARGYCVRGDNPCVQLEILRCRLRALGAPRALQLTNGARCIIRNSIVEGAHGCGVEIEDKSILEMHDCRVSRCTGNGIRVDDGGDATVGRTHVCFNNGSGIQISGARARLQGSGILAYNNDLAGVSLSAKAHLALEECELYANFYGCLVEDGDIRVLQSLLSHNSHSGIHFRGSNLRGTVTGCSFVENGSFGIFCQDAPTECDEWEETELTVQECLLSTHRSSAVHFGDHRNGNLRKCTMFGDGGHLGSGMALVSRHENEGTVPNDFRALIE